jgi:hypothetical protein
VTEETREETRGSLFPLQPVLGWRSGSCRRVCVDKWRGRAYRWRRLHLRTATRPFPHFVGRRSVPPRILAIGQQTGRERPRVLNAVVAQGAGGVAHVLSAAGPTIWPAACEGLVVTTGTDTRRRASRVAPEGLRARCHHTCRHRFLPSVAPALHLSSAASTRRPIVTGRALIVTLLSQGIWPRSQRVSRCL